MLLWVWNGSHRPGVDHSTQRDSHIAVSQYRLGFNNAFANKASGRQGFENKPPIQARTICRCAARDNKSLWHNKRRVPSSWWGIPYGMNSISNDHPSAYYRCDYEPFVCFIMALNLRGFNECLDVKPSSPQGWEGHRDCLMWHRGVLCFFTHSSLLFVSLYSWQPQILSELFMASVGITMQCWGFEKKKQQRSKHAWI